MTATPDPAPSCSDCHHFDQGHLCRLRSRDLPEPELALCANHPAFDEFEDNPALAAQRPIGPVLALVGADSVELAPSPDSEAVRRTALDVAAEVDSAAANQLPFRAWAALWQLQEWNDRRGYVALDRLDGPVPRLRHPGAAAASESSGTRRPGQGEVAYRSPTVPGVVACVLIGWSAVLRIGCAFVNEQTLGLAREARTPATKLARMMELRNLLTEQAEFEAMLGLATLAMLLLTGIAFVVWFHRAYRNLRSEELGSRRTRFSPGWAIWVWIVPILNLFQPLRIMKELRQRIVARSDLLAIGWWLSWFLSGYFGVVPARVALLTELDVVTGMVRVVQVSAVACVLSAVMAIQLIRSINRHQTGDREALARTFE